MRRMIPLCAVALVALTGCYHATIETGLAPSPQTVEKSWAHGWLFGLVPPSTVETKEKCAKGASKVETNLSLANQIAGILTSGIYTPMEIKVTCAQ